MEGVAVMTRKHVYLRSSTYTREQLLGIIEQHRVSLTRDEILQKYGLTKSQLKYLLKLHGLKLTKRRFPARYYSSDLITNEAREILIGELLGDGCIPKGKRYFVLSNTNIEHVEFVKHQLSIPSSVRRYISSDLSSKRKVSYYLQTKDNDFFLYLRDKFYLNGKKIIPSDLVLTPRICRHWYYGDGYYTNPDSRGRRRVYLCTNCFRESDIRLLQSILFRDSGVKFLVHRVDSGKEYMLYIVSKTEKNKWFNYIGSCELDCYNHKWEANNEHS